MIKKLYAKYFLDFVLFGFSPDSVKSIVDAGTDEPSEYSFSTNKRFDKTIFKQFRKVILRALWVRYYKAFQSKPALSEIK